VNQLGEFAASFDSGLALERPSGVKIERVAGDLQAGASEPPRHVAAHSAEADHADVHVQATPVVSVEFLLRKR
jgi:hypothetical protein